MPVDDKNISKTAKAAYQIIYLRHGGQVAASQTDLEVASCRMPFAGRVVSVHAFARALTGTVTYLLHKNDATLLTGNITPVAGAQTAGTLSSTPTFAAGDEIQFKVTTAATSTSDDGGLTVVVRPDLLDEARR